MLLNIWSRLLRLALNKLTHRLVQITTSSNNNFAFCTYNPSMMIKVFPEIKLETYK